MNTVDRIPLAELVLPTCALGIGILLWWLVAVSFALPAYLLPSPIAVATRLLDSPRLYLTNAVVTLEHILIGGTVGIGSGIVIAMLIVQVPLLRRALVPYLVTIRVLPTIAIAPLLLIYFGSGFTTAIVFVALIGFFPMVVSTVAGLDAVPEQYLDLFASIDVGPLATFRHLRLPYALPDVFAGLKQSVTLAVIGAVIAEWLVSTEGLGALILLALEYVQTSVLLAATVVLFIEGMTLYGLVVIVERRVLWNY